MEYDGKGDATDGSGNNGIPPFDPNNPQAYINAGGQYTVDPTTGKIIPTPGQATNFAPPSGMNVPPGYTFDPATGQLRYDPSSGAPPLDTSGLTPPTAGTAGAPGNQAGWTPTAAATVTPPATGGGGGGAAGAGGGSLVAPFGKPFAPPTPQGLPTLAGSVTTIPGAPAVPNIPAFKGPTIDEAMNDPGYKFGEQQGSTELKNWLAAHGTFNDSSAANALTDYGRNAAQTQYNNVWNRAYQAYGTNVASQYLTPWEMQYQNWQAGTAQPTEQNFATTYAGTQHANDMNWQNSWNQWLQDWNIFRDQRDSTFNKQFATATA